MSNLYSAAMLSLVELFVLFLVALVSQQLGDRSIRYRKYEPLLFAGLIYVVLVTWAVGMTFFLGGTR